MITSVLQVALGGAIGASARFALGVWIIRLWGNGFPIAIITVNVLGSFAMGLFVVFAHQRGMTHLVPFVMTGVLGGFTTFSAFSLETMTLFEKGLIGQAMLYVGLSICLSVLGLALGLWIGRGLWA